MTKRFGKQTAREVADEEVARLASSVEIRPEVVTVRLGIGAIIGEVRQYPQGIPFSYRAIVDGRWNEWLHDEYDLDACVKRICRSHLEELTGLARQQHRWIFGV